jgi:hypothetical protein
MNGIPERKRNGVCGAVIKNGEQQESGGEDGEDNLDTHVTDKCSKRYWSRVLSGGGGGSSAICKPHFFSKVARDMEHYPRHSNGMTIRYITHHGIVCYSKL